MKIYLTKMILNPLSRKVFTEVGNPQLLHKTISRGFPPIENPADSKPHERKTPRNEYNILHRLDIDRHHGKAVLLVQSEHEPDWSFLGNEFADDIETKEVGENYLAITDGMNLIFRLQANPTKRIGKSDQQAKDKFKPSADNKIRRRVELRTDEERTEWLVRQGLRFGFQIANLKIEPAVRNVMSAQEEKISFRKTGKQSTVTYGSVVFEGILQVTDAELFREALIGGIGQGKAYGFGLLSVAKTPLN